MRPEEDVCAEWEQKLLINLSALEGLEIISIRAQIVAPEINQVFLQANETEVCICPWIGGEVIRITKGATLDKEGMVLRDVAKGFWGLTIAQARAIGSAWNGHGIEISFLGKPTETLIVTSVECKENNTEVSDALRIATCKYVMESEDGA